MNFQTHIDNKNNKVIEHEKAINDNQNSTKTTSSLDQMKTSLEIREMNDKLIEQKKDLVNTTNDLIIDGRSLTNMHKQLESFDNKDYGDGII